MGSFTPVFERDGNRFVIANTWCDTKESARAKGGGFAILGNGTYGFEFNGEVVDADDVGKVAHARLGDLHVFVLSGHIYDDVATAMKEDRT